MPRRLILSLLCLCLLGMPLAPHASAQAKPKSDGKKEAKKDGDAEKREALLSRYFGICDLDDGSWISFREASATMGITKSEFRNLDKNNDGRFTLGEFTQNADRVLSLLGALPSTPSLPPEPQPRVQEPRTPAVQTATSVQSNPFVEALSAGKLSTPGKLDLGSFLIQEPERAPAPTFPEPRAVATAATKSRAPRLPYPSPVELLELFDTDRSAGLSRREIKFILTRLQANLSPDVIVDRTDRNQSGELESHELGPLSFMVARRLPANGFLSPELAGSTGASQLEWERKHFELGKPLNGLSGIERFSHFSRLDSDGDGKIDSSDLRKKLTQSHSSVRASAIISALDADGDGSINSEEFLVAMRGRN